MKSLRLPLLVFVCGCTTKQQNSVRTPISPATATPFPTQMPASKPTPRPKPVAEKVSVLSRDGRIEAIGTLWRAPTLHGGVEVRNARTKRTLANWNIPDGVTSLSLSPDNSTLAVGNVARLTLWKWKAKKQLAVKEQSASRSSIRVSSDFSPDGRWLAASDNEGVVLFDTRSWKKRFFDTFFAEHVVFTPDSRFVVVSQWEGVAYSLISTRGKQIQLVPQPNVYGTVYGARGEPLFSRDGGLMVLGVEGERTEVQVWSVARMRLLRKFSLPGEQSDFMTPTALSPNARLLASQGSDDNQKGLVAVQRLRDGKTLLFLKQDCDSLRWANDRTLEIQTGKTKKRLTIKGVFQ